MPRPPRRVAVVGSPGSGKTRFARQLAKRTGLPLHHLDDHYWWEGWRPTPEAEWPDVVAQLAARPCWIIDGNYAATLGPRVGTADAIVLFDLPPVTCIAGIVRRSVQIAVGRTEDLPRRVREGPGRPAATHDLSALLALVLSFRRSTLPDVWRVIEESAPDVWLVRVQSRDHANEALRGLANAAIVNT